MNVTVKMAVAAAAIMVSGNAFANEATYESTLNVVEPAETCVIVSNNNATERTVEVGETMADSEFGSGQIEINFDNITLECDAAVNIDTIDYLQTYSQSMIDAGMDGNVTLGRRLEPADEVSDVLLPNTPIQIVTRFRAAGFETFENNVIPVGTYVISNLFTITYD